jgi:multicomponent Na+:H+ antiporter subunit C
VNVLLAAAAGLLFAIGTYLVLQRKLSRIIIGLGLLAHGANLLFVTAGRQGAPALIGEGETEQFSDPLPQALTLTAIVITFAATAFLLALAYRSWLLTHDDEVEHDLADIDIRLGRGSQEDDADLLDFTDDDISDDVVDEAPGDGDPPTEGDGTTVSPRTDGTEPQEDGT